MKTVDKKVKFYVIATPIGNLGDITFRAVETLRKVDLILCEDTRVTAKLLNHYEIKKPLLSYHQRSKFSRTETIIEHLQNGKTLALVTDAGTPGISDPGNELIGKILEHFSAGKYSHEISHEIEITPIPGPSALAALVSVAGIDMSKFVFLGFPPHKKGRKTFFTNMLAQPIPVVYYDSPHRFLKNLELLESLCVDEKKRANLIVGRELTKMFEQIKRGTVGEMIRYFNDHSDKAKGEFTIIVY